MKTETMSMDPNRIKTFISDNKILIAALGGITVGLTLASLLGNEKARQILRSVGSSVASLSGKLVNDLGGYKQLISPLLGKSETQGL
jgi:hypothetical protein